MQSSKVLKLAPIILALLVSCQLNPEYATETSTTMTPFASCPVQPESTRISSALLIGTQATSKETVAALGFTSDAQNLWIALTGEAAGQEGKLVQVRLADWQILHVLEMGSLNARFTRFSGDVRFIVSFSPVPCPMGRQGNCAEPRVWRTTTGELIASRKQTNLDWKDIAFAKQGKWLLAVEGAATFTIHDPESMRGVPTIRIDEAPQSIVAGTLNNLGDLVAYSIRPKQGASSRIIIEGWNGDSFKNAYLLGFGPINTEVEGGADIDVVPIKLAIAPNNKWLAVQFDEGLELRDMASGTLPQQGKVTLPLTSNGLLEFNPSGSLLAVAHAQGLRIYTVPDLKLSLDKPGPQTTAIAFSSDGCTLAWGDVEGIVHIINAPKP